MYIFSMNNLEKKLDTFMVHLVGVTCGADWVESK